MSSEEENIKAHSVKEILDTITSTSHGKEFLKKYVDKLGALQDGKAVSWHSTQYPKQVVRMTLKVEVPSSMEIKDLLNEIKKVESKMNEDSELRFSIEFGT